MSTVVPKTERSELSSLSQSVRLSHKLASTIDHVFGEGGQGAKVQKQRIRLDPINVQINSFDRSKLFMRSKKRYAETDA